MIRKTKRTARKSYKCGCGYVIRPGDTYIEIVASPNHEDFFNPFWWRLQECSECATRYGRL